MATPSSAASSMARRRAAQIAASHSSGYLCGHLRMVWVERLTILATASQPLPAARASTARRSTDSEGGFLVRMGITGL